TTGLLSTAAAVAAAAAAAAAAFFLAFFLLPFPLPLTARKPSAATAVDCAAAVVDAESSKPMLCQISSRCLLSAFLVTWATRSTNCSVYSDSGNSIRCWLQNTPRSPEHSDSAPRLCVSSSSTGFCRYSSLVRYSCQRRDRYASGCTTSTVPLRFSA